MTLQNTHNAKVIMFCSQVGITFSHEKMFLLLFTTVFFMIWNRCAKIKRTVNTVTQKVKTKKMSMTGSDIMEYKSAGVVFWLIAHCTGGFKISVNLSGTSIFYI